MRPRGDRGESLVEVLVAVIILGVAGVAILAGVELAVKSSDLGRKQANGGSYVRSLAEAIQNYIASGPGKYKPCAGANYYTGLSAVTSQDGIPSSSGYVIAQTLAQSWSGTGWGACSTDNGVQRVVLTVTSPGSGAMHQAMEQLTLVIRNPCSGSAGSSACA